jgi:putative flippase GtrA
MKAMARRLLASQIFRFLCSGALAVGVRVVFFYVFSIWWPSGLARTDLTHGQRAVNNLIAISLAFLLSNLTAYLTNRAWVFQPGRHSQAREFAIFTVISLIGLGLGSIAGPGMIAAFGISGNLALFNSLAVQTVTNYLGRKYLVFSH